MINRDFAPFKPIYLPSENLGEYQVLFSPDNKKGSGCYLAPERFVTASLDERQNDKILLEDKKSIDVFSVGCVIAEIFLGKPLFDLPRLQSYKTDKKFSLQSLLNEINNKEIESLIADMIQLDPSKRKTIDNYISLWSQKAFPGSFITFLYRFSAFMLYPLLCSPDNKIAYIYKYLDAIWMVCFQKPEPHIPQSVNPELFEKLREDPICSLTQDEIIPTMCTCCVSIKNFNRQLDWEIIKEFSSHTAKYYYLHNNVL